MSFLTVSNVSVKGVGACVPKGVEENIGLSCFADKSSAEAFISSTGIERRRVVDSDTTTSDLCYAAATKLIDELEWERDSVDCLIFVTQTPDYILPATSCILQQRLGLSTECYAVDILLGCSGWVYGLSVLSSLMAGGCFKRGLLLVGDTLTKITSPTDKSSWPLFGDAGTVTALEFDPTAKDINFHFATDGAGWDAIVIEDGGCRNGTNADSLTEHQIEDGVNRNKLHLALNGMDVFTFGISKAPSSIKKLCEKFSIDAQKVDYLVFHQANKFMNEKIRKKLNLTENQVPYSLRDFGNTSSASIPITMAIELKDKLGSEQLSIIGCGFGVGLSWGSVALTTNKIKVCDLIEI